MGAKRQDSQDSPNRGGDPKISAQRALGVVRLSSWTGSGDPSTSPDRQREHIVRVAEARGLTVVGYATDLDVSASVSPFNRPELGEWLATPDRYDALIVWRLDRISRSVRDTDDLITFAKKHGINLISATEPVDLSSSMGEGMVILASLFAKMERESISEKVKDSRHQLRKLSRYAGGTYPFWLIPAENPDGNGYVLIHNTEGAPLRRGEHSPETPAPIDVITELCDRIASGESQARVIDDFNRRGVPGPDVLSNCRKPRKKGSTRWSHVSMRSLRSRALLGETTHRENAAGDNTLAGVEDVVRDENGMPILFAPPVVSYEKFQQIQEQLDAVKPVNRRPRDADASPLTSLVFCAICGAPRHYRHNMVPQNKRVHQEHRRKGQQCEPAGCVRIPYHYLGCANKWRLRSDEPDYCSSGNLRAEDVHSAVAAFFLGLFGRTEVRTPVHRPAQDATEELAKARDALNHYYGEFESKGEAVQEIQRERIANLESRIEHLSTIETKPAKTDYVPTGQTYGDVWQNSSDPEKRDLLMNAGLRVYVARLEDFPETREGGFAKPGELEFNYSRGAMVLFAVLPMNFYGRVTGTEPDQ